ncbi:MAG TPA: NAD-dependent epimerase/dehydratase family protein, partial [bacterium]|nr:NAD-dependent epimerase/dehydratase family protein [bacterium]
MASQTRHILLGAGGSVSKCLTQELLARKQSVTWVSRRGAEHEGVAAVRADLLDLAALTDAVEADATVYLLAGLQYKLAVWREQWPLIMKNVIAACREKNARLVFLDNVYLYGKVVGPMTETTPVSPVSGKGKVRAAIAETLMSEIRAGRIRAMIARSADFYGPFADATSAFNMMVLAKYAKGKSA